MRTPRTDVRTNPHVEIIYKELSYELGGLFLQTHDALGRYARENHYGNFFEQLLQKRGIPYEREKAISRTGSDVSRPDFIAGNKVAIEFKAKQVINEDDYYQLKRYLEFANLRLGLLVNFRQRYLKPKRVINSKYREV